VRRWLGQFLQRPAVDRVTGERLGQVQRFLVDPAQRAVVALLLREPADDRPASLVPLGQVASFGQDAIMIDGPPARVDGGGLDDWPGAGLAPGWPIGLPVLTAAGERLGRVADLRFNFQNGAIEELMVRTGFFHDLLRGSRRLPGSAVAVFGPHALILEETIRP
jgi:uncharacterized protein YrrD